MRTSLELLHKTDEDKQRDDDVKVVMPKEYVQDYANQLQALQTSIYILQGRLR
jgi:hypothetical protein